MFGDGDESLLDRLWFPIRAGFELLCSFALARTSGNDRARHSQSFLAGFAETDLATLIGLIGHHHGSVACMDNRVSEHVGKVNGCCNADEECKIRGDGNGRCLRAVRERRKRLAVA